jgi:hypothetical protein
MSHFGNDVSITATTPSEWLRTGSQIGELVNGWALRSDLAVMMADQISAPVPALYSPERAEIEINIPRAFGAVSPELLGDLRNRKQQFDNPRAMGAIIHEACHARFSRYDLRAASKELNENQFAALMALEESRAEGWGAATMPNNKAFLRSCALEIVLADVHEELGSLSDIRAAGKLAALALARVDIGILEEMDVVSVSSQLEMVLGADILNQLREVWLEFQSQADHFSYQPLLPLAIKWDEIISKAAQDAGQEDGDGNPTGGSGEMSDLIREMMDALAEDAEQTGFAAARDLADQEQTENWQEDAKARSSASKQRAEHRKVSTKIFEQKPKADGEPVANTNSRLIETRKPKSLERSAAVRVGQMLEKAKYRERDLTVRKTVVPAGRLRTRALVQQQALKAVGVNQQVEAWQQKVRKHTDEPTLSIGVMVDISGSMGHAMNPMATTAWVMSEAGRRVQAKTAMVYYGQDVFPTLKAGQHLSEVRVYSAADGTEKFDLAFQALDGGVNLLEGTGARLLVVVSDGAYTSPETAAAKKWLRECQRSGVGVLWISYNGQNRHAKQIIDGTDAVLVDVDNDPTAASIAIGKAAVDAMNKVGVRQMA